jgi:hypothetical protein
MASQLQPFCSTDVLLEIWVSVNSFDFSLAGPASNHIGITQQLLGRLFLIKSPLKFTGSCHNLKPLVMWCPANTDIEEDGIRLRLQ